MHQGLCIFDQDGRITVVNRRYAEILGLPPEDVRVGMTGREVLNQALKSAEELELNLCAIQLEQALTSALSGLGLLTQESL